MYNELSSTYNVRYLTKGDDMLTNIDEHSHEEESEQTE